MPAEKKLILRCVFGRSLNDALLLAAHPDETHDEQGSPRPDARTLVLGLQGDRAVFREQLSVPLVRCWYSQSGTAYCGSVQRNTLHTYRAGVWSEEVFSESPLRFPRFVYAFPGEKAADDIVLVSALKQLFIRQQGKWQSKRVTGEGRPYQIVGSKADEIYVGGTELFVWNGKKLQQVDEPADDTPELLALSEDRLVAGRTYVSASTQDGGWERIDLPMKLFTMFAGLGRDVYALSSDAGVVRVYPGKPDVVTRAIPDAEGIVAVGDGLIVFGEHDVLAFDGTKWFDVQMPTCEVGKPPR